MINANKQPTSKINSYLATAAQTKSLDLEPKEIQKIGEAINPVIADGFALYEKTKNFSLNLTGLNNSHYQLLFDQQAQEIFASMDELAEQVRQIGFNTVRSISHTGELQSVENYNSDFLSTAKMIVELITDNQQIAASLHSAGKICEKMGQTQIGNILRNILDQTESRIRLLSKAEMEIPG